MQSDSYLVSKTWPKFLQKTSKKVDPRQNNGVWRLMPFLSAMLLSQLLRRLWVCCQMICKQSILVLSVLMNNNRLAKTQSVA